MRDYSTPRIYYLEIKKFSSHENTSKLILITVYSKDRTAIDVLTTSGKQSLRINVSCSHGYSSWIEPIGAADQLG